MSLVNVVTRNAEKSPKTNLTDTTINVVEPSKKTT